MHSELNGKALATTLSPETYALAAKMVPGGIDRIKRTVVRTSTLVNGRAKQHREIHEVMVSGNIRAYLPKVMLALKARQLNDTDMLMMALATIRAESAAFQPIGEGLSKYNTTPIGTAGRHAFDMYDFRSSLGNDALGDGALYKGRGFVQLTGWANYSDIGAQIKVDLVKHPDLANEPEVASAVLAQFLRNKEAKIRAALKLNDLKSARKLVNGGSHGLQEFKASFTAGRHYLGIVITQSAKATVQAKARKAAASKTPAAKSMPPKAAQRPLP